jgi:BMFP domain-containing protein YqiC
LSEVNNNYKKMEARLAEIEAKREETKVVDPQEQVVKTQLDKYLKEMGYVSKEDFS